jgi:hypothetical protein
MAPLVTHARSMPLILRRLRRRRPFLEVQQQEREIGIGDSKDGLNRDRNGVGNSIQVDN